MLLRALGLGPKKPASVKLPQVQAGIDVVVIGGPKGTVVLEALDARSLTVQALAGMRPGARAVFQYQNASGRFRFSTKCIAVKGHQAVFAMPQQIETVQVFASSHQRAAVRIDATLAAQWRHAIAGKGQGDFVRSSITDLSRTGSSLIVEREMKKGANVEVKFSLGTAPAPLVMLGEVMRVSKIEASGKYSLGLRFLAVKAEEDRAIMEFINKRQAERRSRGLV